MSSPSGASFSLRCLIYKVHAVPGGTLLLYKTSSRLSRTFFRSFLASGPSRMCGNFLSLPHLSFAVKNFFHFSPAQLITAPTALLEYQILPPLSIPFFPFLDFFQWLSRRPCSGRSSAMVFAGSARFFAHSLLFILSPCCYNKVHARRRWKLEILENERRGK